jgi:hypothetical protein
VENILFNHNFILDNLLRRFELLTGHCQVPPPSTVNERRVDLCHKIKLQLNKNILYLYFCYLTINTLYNLFIILIVS